MLLKFVLLAGFITVGSAVAIGKSSGNDTNVKQENNEKIADDEVIVIDGPLEKCEPGRRYKLDCNTCFCAESGILGCTLMGCSTATIRPIAYPDLPDGPCEVGMTYQKDCNTCFCGEDSVPYCGNASCSVHSGEQKKIQATDAVTVAEKQPEN